MVEIIKLLIDEPERISKTILFSVKGILSFIVANKVYIYFFGEYSLIEFTNFSEWLEFILSGRILICTLIFFVSNTILFQILTLLPIYLLDTFVKKIRKSKIDDSTKQGIRWFLRVFDIIKIDKKTGDIKLGKNLDITYEAVQPFNTNEAREEAQAIKHSLIGDLFNTYYVFVVVYFFILTSHLFSQLDHLIVSALFILALTYIGLSVLIDILLNYSKFILEAIKALKIQDLLYKIIKENADDFFELKSEKDTIPFKCFKYKDAEYLIIFHYDNKSATENQVQWQIDHAIENQKKVLFVSNRPLVGSVDDLISQYKNTIKTIVFDSEDDLVRKINMQFE